MANSTARLASARRTFLTVSVCAALGIHALPSHAAGASGHVVAVSTCEDDGSPGTLRAAIDGASDGDTIDLSGLACSLITLHSGPLISPVATLTIRGPGVDALTIDGNDLYRVLQGEVVSPGVDGRRPRAE